MIKSVSIPTPPSPLPNELEVLGKISELEKDLQLLRSIRKALVKYRSYSCKATNSRQAHSKSAGGAEVSNA
jgi:hypothetical protein